MRQVRTLTAAVGVASFRRCYLDRAARSIGRPGHYPHELRHTAASHASAAGATVKSVQQMQGQRLGDAWPKER